MADKAHAKTDEKLEEMENRLSAIYSRAEKEIQKTADEYFSKFAKQDESKRNKIRYTTTDPESGKATAGNKMYEVTLRQGVYQPIADVDAFVRMNAV